MEDEGKEQSQRRRQNCAKISSIFLILWDFPSHSCRLHSKEKNLWTSRRSRVFSLFENVLSEGENSRHWWKYRLVSATKDSWWRQNEPVDALEILRENLDPELIEERVVAPARRWPLATSRLSTTPTAPSSARIRRKALQPVAYLLDVQVKADKCPLKWLVQCSLMIVSPTRRQARSEACRKHSGWRVPHGNQVKGRTREKM